VIAVFRPNAQSLGVDLSVPSVCGGFLGVFAEETDLRGHDRGPAPEREVAVVMIVVVRVRVHLWIVKLPAPSPVDAFSAFPRKS
jgi:hypothetical protein